ncbi:alpha/beta fold hydrolase, partial [Amycolatopsis sp. SID8362]|uniref:alpha/beta fold hydrolase n=1 Tax=Amycolatopsis sp. SID8362 TaxID=2690346 RepID=UPI001367CED8
MTTASRLRDPSLAHRFVASDGAALHVAESGPASSAVTLVLVHGWTQDHRTWDFVLPHLDPGVRVLRYDLRGHGGSAHARPGSATIARLADDLAELIASRVPEGPVVLAGHSMGGMTLMVLAERHPSLVRDRLAGAAFVATSSGDMDKLTLGFPGLAGRSVTRLEPRLARLLARL